MVHTHVPLHLQYATQTTQCSGATLQARDVYASTSNGNAVVFLVTWMVDLYKWKCEYSGIDLDENYFFG